VYSRVLDQPDRKLKPPLLNQLRSSITFLCIAAVVVGCASGPGTKAGQRQAHEDLDDGLCPSFIIYPGDRTQAGRERYSDAATEKGLANYRDRELANCENALASGDAAALNVLLEYWYAQNNQQEVAATYKAYLQKGSDVRELGEAGARLYTMYSEGAPGLPPDPDKALHYLSLAAKYDPSGFALSYADALHARGLYADSFPHYKAVTELAPPAENLSKVDLCEINLKLADLYFQGRGVRENWYVGYYYWLQGLSMAADPDWGSCVKFTYYDRDRYSFESARKRAIDRRLERLGSGETSRIKAAWTAPDKGLAYIAALDFRRPFLPESAAVTALQSASDAPELAPEQESGHEHESSAAWPTWAPVGGEICQWQTASGLLNWSEVFQLRSGAIWTVKSMAGKAQSVGSAVAVSPNTLLTNCHLIHDPSGVTLLTTGRAIHAKVLAADREGDRCILQTSETLPTYVASAKPMRALLVGEDVAAIGNPKGLDTSLSRGLIAQKRNKNGHAYIQTDAALSSGSSGGGLFDTAGNLVGVTTFKVATGENLNFAIAIDEFCR
jgi:serine protease Do